MVNKFRTLTPVRKCAATYGDYTKFKSALSKDFNTRCGYTDCSHFWFGGPNNFHIDHFIPWKNYPLKPNLKTDYSNLVYSCSYVNILKSNDEGNYLDPCNIDFNAHFERDSAGNIIPKMTSKEANYMYKRLKLYMKRYQIIWMLDNLMEKMERLKILIDAEKNGKLRNALLITQGELSNHLIEYFAYLKKEQ